MSKIRTEIKLNAKQHQAIVSGLGSGLSSRLRIDRAQSGRPWLEEDYQITDAGMKLESKLMPLDVDDVISTMRNFPTGNMFERVFEDFVFEVEYMLTVFYRGKFYLVSGFGTFWVYQRLEKENIKISRPLFSVFDMDKAIVTYENKARDYQKREGRESTIGWDTDYRDLKSKRSVLDNRTKRLHRIKSIYKS